MLLLISLLLICQALPAPADSPVSFRRSPDRLDIRIAGEPFATYVWSDPSIKRPYFAHVRTPSGFQVTRNNPPVEGRDATDHTTMHPGLWLAFGDIDGVDFWRNQAVVRHAGFEEEPTTDSQGGRFAVRNAYVAGDRAICEEICRIGIRVTSHGYLIDWRSEFRGPGAFAFGDQEEMGLGVRMATESTVVKGGEIIDSEGRRNEEGVWGQQADWCGFSGEQGGIMLMPDPANLRRCWFHARDYGLLVANPFGRRAFTKGEPSRVIVGKGETLTIRFGVLVHDGQADRRAAYRDFLEAGVGPQEADGSGSSPGETGH